MDEGFWEVMDGGEAVISSDFTHDVVLRISGDFASVEQKYRYAQWLCDALNKSISNALPSI